MDDEIDFDSLPRRRTAKGQFAKGSSGNPIGRPRTKHQRAISSRQVRRDVLAVTEEPIPVRTASGTDMVPCHVVTLKKIRAKAMEGHAPSQRFLYKLHQDAVREHEEANALLNKLLENAEANAVNKSVDRLKKWEWKELNLFRKFSWRF